MSFSITLATTPEQREAVFRLRYTVVVEEAHVSPALADHQFRCIEEPLDVQARLLVARYGDTVVGALRSNYLGEGDWGGEAALLLTDTVRDAHPHAIALSAPPIVASGFRTSAVPLRLVAAAFAMHLDEGISHDFVAAPPEQERFYQSLGYRPYAGRIVHPERGDVLPLVLVLRDRAHLEAIHSPLAESWREREREAGTARRGAPS
jgi:hypothetical protein